MNPFLPADRQDVGNEKLNDLRLDMELLEDDEDTNPFADKDDETPNEVTLE